MSERGHGLRPLAAGFVLYASLAACVFAGLLLFYAFCYPLHHDLAGIALSGRLAVTLGDSFRDYSIYFPPADRAWFSVASGVSDLTGLRLDLAVVVMTGAAILFSGGLAYRIRRDTLGASPLFLLSSVALLVVLPILYKNIFGMREHLVVLGLWPYVVLRLSDPNGTRIGWRLRLVLGLWIGLTLLFKYLYCVVVLLVELTDVLVQRRPQLIFRLENIVSGAVVVLYLFCWLGLDPSQRVAIGIMFSGLDAALIDPKVNRFQVASSLLPAIFFSLACLLFKSPRRVGALGLALVVGAVIVAWAQERWYTHHLFAVTVAYLAWWWMSVRTFRWWATAAISFYFLITIGTAYLETAPYREAVAELDRAMANAGQSVAGKRVGVLTMHPSPYNQYLASHGGLRWNTQVNNAYIGAELKSFDTKEHSGKLAPALMLADPGRKVLHDEMLRLWEDMPPDALILDHSSRFPLRYIDVEWTRVFSKDPRFNAFLKRYRPAFTYDGERIEFKYYVRVEQGSHQEPKRDRK